MNKRCVECGKHVWFFQDRRRLFTPSILKPRYAHYKCIMADIDKRRARS